MQSTIEDAGVVVTNYRCTICPTNCTSNTRSVGEPKFKIRQVCLNFPHMDGNTNWEKV